MTSPIYWIDGPWQGRLAILPRPRGGDWLEDEARAWRAAGLKIVVSALEPAETTELQLSDEAQTCAANGLEFWPIPIPDRGVPSESQFAGFLDPLEERLATGTNVGIHCRQGVGRSALIAAALLAGAGVSVEQAWNRVEAARGCPVPDTLEQREWLAKFARAALANSKGE